MGKYDGSFLSSFTRSRGSKLSFGGDFQKTLSRGSCSCEKEGIVCSLHELRGDNSRSVATDLDPSENFETVAEKPRATDSGRILVQREFSVERGVSVDHLETRKKFGTNAW